LDISGWWILQGELSGDLCVRGRFLWCGFNRAIFRSWSLGWDCSYVWLWCLSWSNRSWRFSRSLNYRLFDSSWLFDRS
jgi:hypothetical protein